MRSVTEYNAEFMRLAARNQLSKNKNQQAVNPVKRVDQDPLVIFCIYSVAGASDKGPI